MVTCSYGCFFCRFGAYHFTRSWRRTRRAGHEMLTKVAVRDYHPIFRKEAVLLASAFLKNPDTSEKHILRSSASATMSMLYDYPTIEDEQDETLNRIHEFLDRMSAAAAPGAYLADLFHWMIYIPKRYIFISSIVCLIIFRIGTPDLQNGNVRQWKITRNIRECSMDFWTLCLTIS